MSRMDLSTVPLDVLVAEVAARRAAARYARTLAAKKRRYRMDAAVRARAIARAKAFYAQKKAVAA
jgi:hypothetical protein